MTDPQIQSIVSRPELVDKIGEVQRVRDIEEGLNSIYVLQTEDKEYVLKVRTNHRNEIGWFRAEPVIYRRLECLSDVPSPEIIYSDVSGEDVNAFFVMGKIEGANPAGFKEDLEIGVLEKVLRELGRFLGQIHSEFEVNDYGMLEASEGELRSEHNPEKWTWHIQGALEELENHIEEGWDEDLELDLPSKNEVAELLPERPESVLLHLDNRLDNLLMDGNEITGFLDWSHPEAGHAEYDIVRAEYLLIDYDLDHLASDKKQRLRDALYQGYEEVRDIERGGFEARRALYRQITVVWLLAGFPNWKSSLSPSEQEEMREYLLEKANLELEKE